MKRLRQILLLYLGLLAALQASGQLAMPDSVCPGELKHYWVDPTPGSTYTWMINGVAQGSVTNDLFVTWDLPYTPSGSPYTVTVQEHGANGCPGPVKSGQVVINPVLAVGVNVTANPNPFCPGTPVVYTATPVNGGTNPVYVWRVNGKIQGTNSPIYIYSPIAGDIIYCELTSSVPCALANTATSNPIIMTAFASPYVQMNICNNITTRDAQPFILKGGFPPGGIYSGPGVAGNIFSPALVPPFLNTVVITYKRTNLFGCADSAQGIITVYPALPFVCGNNFTDVRDSKTYRTIQIASQCWMAANLNFGNEVPATIVQRDNCTPEKFCSNDNPANCTLQGGLYQWDELMQFDETQALQGLCPPAWHIPDENEWNTLFAVYNGNGFAGDQLRSGGPSGFDALLTGARFMDTQWALDTSAFFWSSTPHGPYKAWAHSLNSINHGVSYYPSSRENAFSVRCLKD